MRIRATVAAVSGALALSALAVPAAQADENPGAAARSALGAPVAMNEQIGDTKITKVVVNNNKNLVLGTHTKKTFTIAVTATDPSGIDDAFAFLWHGTGTDIETANIDGAIIPDGEATCTKVNATTSTCKITLVADARTDLYKNGLAGNWKVYAAAVGNDGDLQEKDAYKTHRVQRLSRLSANASPEPVKKGKTITVKGRLTRANWATDTFVGFGGQKVKLQFKKKGATSFTTLKTITGATGGYLKTTVTANVDGSYRFYYPGNYTTAPKASAADFIDVQ
ncbi:calcium-binding protein [Streptomyces sp. NPDC002845]